MEDLTEIIQFTATGSYSRGAVYSFATFIGYQDEVAISTTESIPNPLSKVEYVQKFIKDILVSKMSEMEIANASSMLDEEFRTRLEQAKLDSQTNIGSAVVVTVDTL